MPSAIDSAPLAGALLALATVIAMPITSPVPVALWWGLGLLTAGAALVQTVPAASLVAPVLAAPEHRARRGVGPLVRLPGDRGGSSPFGQLCGPPLPSTASSGEITVP